MQTVARFKGQLKHLRRLSVKWLKEKNLGEKYA
jgi:hypothetical protein